MKVENKKNLVIKQDPKGMHFENCENIIVIGTRPTISRKQKEQWKNILNQTKMAKVRTLYRQFMKGHPREGENTHFV